jgi:uracil-DNA glycosylase
VTIALDMNAGAGLAVLHRRIVVCRRCPRLVEWRSKVAKEKRRKYAKDEYWGRPLPGFGDPAARVLLVGLAPAAHGGNRTGRMFTGDESGSWLMRALYETGFANQPDSFGVDDGLALHGCYIVAALRCAPPANKPLPEELAQCRGHLHAEIGLLTNVRVVVGLGKIGFEAALKAFKAMGRIDYKAMPKFGHGVVHRIGNYTFIGTYHPSQQNTFTGKLTRTMLRDVFRKVATLR